MHALSEATVGRILGEAVRKGKVGPRSFCEGRVAAVRLQRRAWRRWKSCDKHVGA